MSDPTGHNLLPQQEHEENDPWLMTFADMVSLLMAFFVILYSMSALNAVKYHDLTDSLRETFKGKTAIGKTSKGKEINMAEIIGSAKEVKQYKSLNEKVNAEMVAITLKMNTFISEHKLGNKVSAFIDDRGVVIKIADEILFAPGEARLSKESQVLIDYLVTMIKEFPYQLRVEGHTDNTPIQTNVYPSNWELSTARACNVVRTFIEKGGNPTQFSAEGFAEYRPIGSNSTVSGKMKNRRVELIYKRESVIQSIKSNEAAGVGSESVASASIQSILDPL
jgi:chemotaxis protein MotB